MAIGKKKAEPDYVSEERRKIEELMAIRPFRLFLMEQMRKCRYLKSQGDIGDYERGGRDARIEMIQSFVFGSDIGADLVRAYVEKEREETK